MIVSRTLYVDEPQFDLPDGVGQRSYSFRFDLLDGVTGEPIVELKPIRAATLSHDTSQTTKRRLRLPLGVEDTALVNPINNRVDVSMLTSDGQEWPLGRYVFTDYPRQQFTSGDLSVGQLTDEMITIDQQIENSINGYNRQSETVVQKVLEDFEYDIQMEASPFYLTQSWGPGAYRGQILQAVALTGDYFSPWFGNDRKFHLIRAFEPANAEPTFNFDSGNQVLRDGITHNNDALTAPNRFVVVGSNSGIGVGSTSVVGSANVPDSAPHSIRNRGFVIPSVVSLPVNTPPQATAVARNLALRQVVADLVTLQTAIDPRHDSYDVILWQGEKWLEVAWSMSLTTNGVMTHQLRKSYT